jgi:hypothetical protein
MKLTTRSLSIITRSRKDTIMGKGNNSQKNDKKNKKPKKDAKPKEIKPTERKPA